MCKQSIALHGEGSIAIYVYEIVRGRLKEDVCILIICTKRLRFVWQNGLWLKLWDIGVKWKMWHVYFFDARNKAQHLLSCIWVEPRTIGKAD